LSGPKASTARREKAALPVAFRRPDFMSTPKGPDDFDDVDVREDQTPDKPRYGDEERCTNINPTPTCGVPTPLQTPACGNPPPKPTHKH
jgi:hypothetical protein